MMNGPRALTCTMTCLLVSILAFGCSNELDGSETKAACEAYAEAANTCWKAATGESPIDSSICGSVDAEIDTCEPNPSGFDQKTNKSLAQIYDCYTEKFTKHHEDGLCTSAESAGEVDVDSCAYECPCEEGQRECRGDDVYVCSFDGEFKHETTCDAGGRCQEDSTTSAYCVTCQQTSFEDALCDGVDEDCDGETDEGFVSEETTCGVGACATTGQTSCVDQALVDDCEPESPTTAVDVICDGIDDDCDEVIDEDFVPGDEDCGMGACAVTKTSCVDGVEACVPGEPAADDITCDGVDDNCDGENDEGYVGAETNCGVGICEVTATDQCVDGAVEAAVCTPAVPDCAGAVCGDDGCGGSCGDCAGGQTCNAGVCE